MIFKSYILEQNIQTVNNHKIFLFYGENQGLKKEFKKNLRIHNKKDEILKNVDEIQQKASIESSAYVEKLQKWEEKHAEIQEVHRLSIIEKVTEINELQGIHKNLKLEHDELSSVRKLIKSEYLSRIKETEPTKLGLFSENHINNYPAFEIS